MDRQSGLREILDTIMAWCAESDLYEARVLPKPEGMYSADELASQMRKAELHRDWNGTLVWALRQALEVQVPPSNMRVRPTRTKHSAVYRNEHLVSALLNVIALCTIWIREIESRPDPPADDVHGKLRERTAELVNIWKDVPYEQQK
jgi:hypothetical protein